MAIYNLFRGGYATEFGKPCRDCGVVDENLLPVKVQPDNRADGGYGYRDKVEWKQLLKVLLKRYGKTVEDLEVGDKLRVFLHPNHANVKAVFFDFRQPVAGFQFDLTSVNGTDLSGMVTEATYSEAGEIEVVSQAGYFDSAKTAQVEERTQWTVQPTQGYNPKVDVIELEIKALPKDLTKLNDLVLLIGRRFEQDGFMM
ncbi:hypothetical protein [Lonepinella koalarum]|uniref:Uncharacterized protein n=1 Tax=Lonepinella koalarum TaxID=53417 RepID=A0A4V2PUD2_9PAST|nr:hypothetical protein [Lonepinella koalarum]MDH2927905.1 hypothetical protein [Lonepinella koalarum]TCK70101.1 hypothetical protein EV692_1327 [Lonepinella koalarum]TFJ90303.1 hypothetical protein E0709_02890 [Lonepinella koalarum]